MKDLTVGYNYNVYIFQISFASASSELSDRARFQYYFRTTPSFVNYGPSILGVLNKYKWKQIAFITQNIGTFIKVCLFIYCNDVFYIIIMIMLLLNSVHCSGLNFGYILPQFLHNQKNV